jgi:pyridoxal phosphate-dependent aminotransferase EpsN
MSQSMVTKRRIYLSPPHMSGLEESAIATAFTTNWVAPLGPHVDAFEQEFCGLVGASAGVALSSGTAALHLALIVAGVRPDDEVVVSTLTFAASVNPIIYLGARPVFIDSERTSWNMDPELLSMFLTQRAREGRLPAAVIVVHLYGQSAHLSPILAVCAQYGVPVIEDACEALGASYQGRSPGTAGVLGVYSFNGNKIITTSGGGMLVSNDAALIKHARKLATQARDPVPYYEHSEIGYNYRLSNVLAAIGRCQLRVLSERVTARRRNFEFYREALGSLRGVQFMPEAPWGIHSRWLTVLTLDNELCGLTPEILRMALEEEDIESRPVWKPMHQQPVFAGYERIGGRVADDLFLRGLCLPSGSNLTVGDLERVVATIHSAYSTAPLVSLKSA